MGVKITKQNASEMGKKAQTPTAKAKRQKTLEQNRLLKTQVYETLRDTLLKTGKNGKAFYQDFIDDYITLARKEPEGKAGLMIAQTIFTPDILSLLDGKFHKNNQHTDITLGKLDIRLWQTTYYRRVKRVVRHAIHDKKNINNTVLKKFIPSSFI